MTPVRLEPVAPRSRVKHSTTEPLHSHFFFFFFWGGGGGGGAVLASFPHIQKYAQGHNVVTPVRLERIPRPLGFGWMNGWIDRYIHTHS